MKIDRLSAYIPVGKNNAIHQKELAERLRITPADVKQLVRTARQQGLQILSGVQGYWFAENESEKKEFVNSMHKHAFSLFKTVTPIKNTIRDNDGQISISEMLESLSDSEEIGGKDHE
jgi:biotin operon repressor